MKRGQGLAEYALVVALIGVVVLVVLGGDDFQAWAVWCGEQGGRVADQHSTGVGYSYGNGQAGSGGVVVTSSTTYFCLSPDGGVLDVR